MLTLNKNMVLGGGGTEIRDRSVGKLLIASTDLTEARV